MKKCESELSKTFKYSLVQDKLCGLTAAPRGARGLRKSPAAKGLAVKANPHQLEPWGGWSPAIDAQTQRRHCKGNMGDENGSGGNKIRTMSHTGGQQTWERKKLLFRSTVFRKKDMSRGVQNTTWAIRVTPCYFCLRHGGEKDCGFLKRKHKYKEPSLQGRIISVAAIIDGHTQRVTWVFLSSHFHHRFCNSQGCSQNPRILGPCQQWSHFPKRIEVQPSHVLKSFLFTRNLQSQVCCKLLEVSFRQSQAGVGKGKEEGTHKELWLCRVAQSSFTELGLMQRRKALIVIINCPEP